MPIEEPRDGGDLDVFDQSGPQDEKPVSLEWVSLPSAGLLSPEGADELRRWREARIVAVVGERKGGKTTLATELFERFVRGPFADQQFVDSRTLAGFEQKSFESRVASGKSKPETARTSAQDDLKFFHLGVGEVGKPTARTDILISERAGETYKEVRNKPALSSSLVEVKHADAVVFVIDGERVAGPYQRNEVFAATRGLLRVLMQGAIPARAAIQIVATKFDLLRGNDVAISALATFEKGLLTTLHGHPGGAAIYHTAARDTVGSLAPAGGLDLLLKAWIKPGPTPTIELVSPSPLLREIDRLVDRVG